MTQVAVLNLNTDLSLCLMVVTGLARDILAGLETWYLRLAMLSVNTELSTSEPGAHQTIRSHTDTQ